MSNKVQSEGHWESHSYESQTTKTSDGPPVTVGKEESVEGTFDVRKVFCIVIYFISIVDYSTANPS